ncbi:MAG: C45 family autoproteolytic acyltransferase/hydrolase, partial [Planctomycetota bacterium]|nr:C45 family autoproteolytic acyltransferase/hydrolase [Planctomycetota bacterium]
NGDDVARVLHLTYKNWTGTATLSFAPRSIDHLAALKGYRVVELERSELERHLARGVRRALEVLAPSPLLTAPDPTPHKVSHGELRWIDGHRVALLQGTPEEVGRAHGELFREEIQRCTDSVLYCFGMVQTIRTGRWFPDELQAAYKRLVPFIPQDHQRETVALAMAAGIDPQIVQDLNVFPEMFHCSGFSVSGAATADGKLYHGRVLDYMTTIGLQHSAVTFVVAIDEKIPFINIGYAGFIGSVSGMNMQQISLGEMGGRGEENWDGVPMATLMRRGLEECKSLADVKKLWETNPRTCEYYYVFADGKDNSACGVAATPEKLQFIAAGETHPLLGDGIPDVVVLSSGERLATLRSRVQEYYGKIDAERAMWLMSRPVAMKSNLHNVLFVPADGVCYVAHADHKSPAAERPYVRLNLKELLAEMALPIVSSEKVNLR